MRHISIVSAVAIAMLSASPVLAAEGQNSATQSTPAASKLSISNAGSARASSRLGRSNRQAAESATPWLLGGLAAAAVVAGAVAASSGSDSN